MEEYVIFYVGKASGFSFECCRFLHSCPQDFFSYFNSYASCHAMFLIEKYQKFMES